jgi:hypothetical protein
MGNDHRVKYASIVLLLSAVLLVPDTASAGGNAYPGKEGHSLSAGYPAPMTSAYRSGGATVGPTYSECCYTFPIQMVYQCPAVLVGQPGSRVGYFHQHPTSGRLGGQPYLYHP